MRRTLAVGALLFGLAACGDSPTQPTNMLPPGTLQLAGNWSGTWTYQAAGLTVTDDLTLTLSQNGATATGSWSAQSGAGGQINFPATLSISGTLTINQALLGAGSCNGTTSIQGSASSDRLEILIGDIPSQGVCQWGTGGRFLLRR